MLTDCAPDSWQAPVTRLTARTALVMGGNATAVADFAILKSQASGVPALGEFSSTDANLNLVLNYAGSYLFYHKSGQDSIANPYAANLWAAASSGVAPVTYITQITVRSGGGLNGSNVATATVASTGSIKNGSGAIWGNAYDALCGSAYYSDITVTSATTFTFSTVYAAPGTYPGGSTTLVTQAPIFSGPNDQYNDSGVALAMWAYFYDWCYDWLVANGHDQFARDQIKAGYWQETLTRGSSQFNQAIRESDFHNYTSWSESSILEAGIALYGDDSLGATILAEGRGYFIDGISGIVPAGIAPDAFTYNLKISKDVLTGGAMNWEGPTYWRAGTIRFLRALEAYDSATGGANNIFGAGGPYNNAVNGAWYKIYLTQPDGSMANFGDGGESVPFSGRDNQGMSILNAHFADGHFLTFMNSVGDPWNDGASGQLEIIYRLMLWPYVNGPSPQPYSNLPLSRRFGPDILIRTGWGATDTFLTYTSSLHGTYHRHDDGGTFTLFDQQPMIQGQPYISLDQVYVNYNRRTIGANTLRIYDPNDCWKDNGPVCGQDYYGNPLVNDGGQLTAFRRYYSQFPSKEFQISRAWSGTLYSDSTWSNLYAAIDPVNQPLFASASAYEHIRNDLTASYVNAYSGTGDNPAAKVAASSGVIRELVHFQPTLGSLNPIVIFDRVNSTNAGYTKTWNIHTVNAPTLNGATPLAAGDTTLSNVSLTQFDNGAGRVFINHLLPANSSVRGVGGSACTPITIQSATTASPAVFYAPSHGLQAGESITIGTGALSNVGWLATQPGWQLDVYYGNHWVQSVIDSDHFTINPVGSYGAIPLSFGIQSCTAANPIVCTLNTSGTDNLGQPASTYIDPGWVAGTNLTFTGATGSWAAINGNQPVTVISSTTFSIPVNGAAFTGSFDGEVYMPYSVAFGSGKGAPTGSGKFSGQMYYQQDAVSGQSVWQWSGSAWVNLTGPNYNTTDTFTGVTITQHTNCNYAYYVDQFGPAGSTGAHLWESTMDNVPANTRPSWRIGQQPPTSETQDYFLNVLHPVTTSLATPPPTSLISGSGIYGAMVTDSGGSYVAVFPTSPIAQSWLSYSANHSGKAQHVVTGLSAVATYSVTQGGGAIANVISDSSGSLTFAETGGGLFQVTYQPLAITSGLLVACRVATPCTSTFTAAGGSGNYTWTVTAGSLPPGFALSSSGTLTGTPAGIQSYSFTVTVQDGNGGASQAITLVVQPPPALIRSGSQSRPGIIVH